jgi:hypothetical protein
MDDKEITRLLRLPPGDRTDVVLAHLLSFPLLGYWTFPTPKGAGTELGDVLVWHDDVLFVIEAKTRESVVANQRWISKRLTEAIDQINDNIAILRSGHVQTLRNAWQGEVPWRPEVVKHYYGIVILQHESDPYEPHEYAEAALKRTAVPIQVYSLFDFAQLLRVINTINDLVVYYELRHIYMSRWKAKVHEELRTYRGVVEDMTRLLRELGATAEKVDLSKAFQERVSRVMILPGEARSKDIQLVASSWLIDVALGSIFGSGLERSPLGARAGIDQTHVVAMSSLAELSRLRRSVWGERWMGTTPDAISAHTGVLTAGHSPNRKRAYVVASSEKSEDERAVWLMPFLREEMAKLSCTSGLALAANPLKIRRTHGAIKHWLTGRAYDLSPDDLMDTTYLGLG